MKINATPKTNLTCQWLFYMLWYIIGDHDLDITVKGWYQTTETITIWCTLTVFKHWGINVKLHCLHVFGIVNWNYKQFKCILSFISSCLWYIFLEKSSSRLLKVSSIQSKPTSNRRCDLAYWPWNLNLSSFLFLFSSVIFNFFGEAWPLVHLSLVPSPFALGYFWHLLVYKKEHLHCSCNVLKSTLGKCEFHQRTSAV